MRCRRCSPLISSPNKTLQAISPTGQEMQRWSGHTSTITCAAWSPDGNFLYTVSQDRSAAVWAATRGFELVIRHSDHRDWVNGVTVTTDGTQWATTGSDNGIKLYASGPSWSLLKSWSAQRPCFGIAFNPVSPNRLVVARTGDGLLLEFDTSTESELRAFDGHASGWWIESVIFNSAGTRIFSASPNGSRVMIHDVATGEALLTVDQSTGRIALSADDSTFFVPSSGKLLACNAANGEVQASVPIAKGARVVAALPRAPWLLLTALRTRCVRQLTRMNNISLSKLPQHLADEIIGLRSAAV
eukprot:TRINITY_DN1333_c0_g1_i3.p1 TRINITY_DN1333_c0_g1~~TRINITY_DN1333_c0_g1_i3.p1  ORF type:complete len:301 (+),score=50.29 TRINITY_DN1333_c0_g1_i3:618-1520(+)